MTIEQASVYLINHPWILMAIIAWELPWKITALWRAARREDRIWFVALLFLNTLAIVDMLYIFIWSKRPQKNSI
ncbi:MAG: DUF5652 family protein [Patescibacteria group bacterium]